MAFRTWARLLLATLGVAALAGASQLGVAYGLGIVRLTRVLDVTTRDQWTAQLAWVAWFAMLAAVVGALAGAYLLPRWSPTRPGTGTSIAIAVAAGAGAAVVVPLTMQPARTAQITGVHPVFVIGICTALGAIAGIFAAVAALMQPVSRWSLSAVSAAVWVLAIISVSPSLAPDDPLPAVRLGVFDAGFLSPAVTQRTALFTMPALALLAGALLGWAARRRELPTLTIALAGLPGPALLTVAYLIAGPGAGADRYEVVPYWAAMTATGAGVLGSVLAAVLRRGAPPEDQDDDTAPTEDRPPLPRRTGQAESAIALAGAPNLTDTGVLRPVDATEPRIPAQRPASPATGRPQTLGDTLPGTGPADPANTFASARPLSPVPSTGAPQPFAASSPSSSAQPFSAPPSPTSSQAFSSGPAPSSAPPFRPSPSPSSAQPFGGPSAASSTPPFSSPSSPSEAEPFGGSRRPYVPEPATRPLPAEPVEPEPAAPPSAPARNTRLGRSLRPFSRGRVDHPTTDLELGTNPDRRNFSRRDGKAPQPPAWGVGEDRPPRHSATPSEERPGTTPDQDRPGGDPARMNGFSLTPPTTEPDPAADTSRKRRGWRRNKSTDPKAESTLTEAPAPDRPVPAESRTASGTESRADRPAESPMDRFAAGPVRDEHTPVGRPFAPEPQTISPPLPNPEPITPPPAAPDPTDPTADKRRATKQRRQDDDYVDWVSGLGGE